MLRATSYDMRTGQLALRNDRGMLIPQEITYMDALPPSGIPNWISHEWLNKFTDAVHRAIDRSRGTCALRAIGGSNSIEGEWVYEMFDGEGRKITETAKNLAAIYSQNPGKWPAVDAYLDRVLGINQ
jgi:hypothetical protein